MRGTAVVCTLILVQAILIATGKSPNDMPDRFYFIAIVVFLVGASADIYELFSVRTK